MKEEKESDLVKVVFGNAKGDKLLAMWEKIYNERPSYVPDRPIEEAVFFEGQRSFLLTIKQLLEMKE